MDQSKILPCGNRLKHHKIDSTNATISFVEPKMVMPKSLLLNMDESHTITNFGTEGLEQVTDLNCKVYLDVSDTDLPVPFNTIDIDSSLEHLDKVPFVPVSPWLNVDDTSCMTEVNLDNIQLYLECSEDGGNSRPLSLSNKPTQLMDIDGTSLIKSDVQFKISFPKFQEENSKVKGFKCCCCKKIFTSEQNLREHVSVAHNNKAFVCQLCMYNTKSKKFFKNHMSTKHKAVTVNSDIELTDIIEKSLASENEAEKITVYFIRPENSTICDNDSSLALVSDINEELTTTTNFNKDTVQDSEGIHNECVSNDTENTVNSIPDDTDTGIPQLKPGSRSEKSPGEPEEPSYDVSNKNTYERNRFTCDVCGFVTKSKALLKSHQDKKHNSFRDKYTCSICQFECLQKRTFERHNKIHIGKFEFKCSVCEKCFYTKASHDRHVKTHQTARNYECDVQRCGKLFKSKGALTDHVKQVHERKSTKGTQTCEGYGTYRENHQKSEKKSCNDSVVKKYACSFNGCNKTFRDNFNLQNHIYTHNKERKLGCKSCDFICIQQTSLNYHYKTKHVNNK